MKKIGKLPTIFFYCTSVIVILSRWNNGTTKNVPFLWTTEFGSPCCSDLLIGFTADDDLKKKRSANVFFKAGDDVTDSSTDGAIVLSPFSTAQSQVGWWVVRWANF